MKTFFRYLGYRLKSSLLLTTALALLSLFIVCLKPNLVTLTTLLGIFVTIIPFLELASLKNKRNLDTLYAFPFSRIKLLAAHYLSGAIQITVIYSFLTVVAALLLTSTPDVDLLWLIPFYLSTLLMGFAIYSIISFLFSAANTVIDGIITVGIWICMPSLLIVLINQVIVQFTPNYATIYHSLYCVSDTFIAQIEDSRFSLYTQQIAFVELYQNLISHILFTLFSLASALLFLFVISKKPAYKAGGVSDAFVCYPFLVPLCTFLALVSVTSENFNALSSVGLILLSSVIGLIVFRRGFRFKKQDLISLSIVLVAAFILGPVGPFFTIETEKSPNINNWEYGEAAFTRYQKGELVINHPIFKYRLDSYSPAQMIYFREVGYRDQPKGQVIFKEIHLEQSFETAAQVENYVTQLKKQAALYYERSLDDAGELFYTVEDEENDCTYLYLKEYTLEGQENTAGYQTNVGIGKDITATCGYAVIAYSYQHLTVMQSYAQGEYIYGKMFVPRFITDRSLNFTVTFE